MSDTTSTGPSIGMACDIVSAYVSHNSLPPSELPGLIASVFSSLNQVAGTGSAPTSIGANTVASSDRPTPAQIRKSVKDDGLVSFEDGKTYKTLKRHLTAHGLSPEQYREKWGLPQDYPMVAPSYSAQRSQLARDIGLGVTARKAA
jgi:predicted transcriptional regulator